MQQSSLVIPIIVPWAVAVVHAHVLLAHHVPVVHVVLLIIVVQIHLDVIRSVQRVQGSSGQVLVVLAA